MACVQPDGTMEPETTLSHVVRGHLSMKTHDAVQIPCFSILCQCLLVFTRFKVVLKDLGRVSYQARETWHSDRRHHVYCAAYDVTF